MNGKLRRRKLPPFLASAAAAALVCGSLLATAGPAAAIEDGFPAGSPSAGTDMAQIWYTGGDGDTEHFICSGSVTAAYKILMATHCFDKIPVESGGYFARVGSRVRGEGKRHDIVKKVSRGDLTVVTTHTRFGAMKTNGYPYAQLGPNERVPRKKRLESHGWGRICEDCGPSDVLKGVDSEVSSNGDRIEDTKGGPGYHVLTEGGRIHQGDSGGPSGYFPGGRVRVVTGVASYRYLRPPLHLAVMSATYDAPHCGRAGAPLCVYDWLKFEAEMQVFQPHDELRRREISVMPLGDSITAGFKSSDGAGYRSRLWSRLDGSTRGVDFVGSQRGGRTADADHEGHSGREIDFVAARARESVPSSRPSLVTLHVGTNDMDRAMDPQAAPERLGRLVDQVLRDSPDTTVLVATLVPSKDATVQERIEAYNDELAELVRERAEAGKHVALVDMHAVTTDDLADSLHPDDGGYDKMADAWFDSIAAVAEAGWVKDAGGGGTCVDQPGGWVPKGKVASGVGAGRTDVRFADIDGDGRDDYLVVDPETGAVRAWTNSGGDAQGKPGWVSRGLIASGTDPDELEYVDFADIDGDGRDDYLLTHADGSIRAWKNAGGDSDGRPGWIPRGRIASGPAGVAYPSVRLADIDGDLDADYLVVDGPTRAVHAWINVGGDKEGRPGWIDQGLIASGVPGADRVLFANVNCDRRADYLDLSSEDGSVEAWINAGGDSDGKPGWIARGRIASGNVGHPDAVVFADIDGDGRDDYLSVTAETGEVHAWINKGGDPA